MREARVPPAPHALALLSGNAALCAVVLRRTVRARHIDDCCERGQQRRQEAHGESFFLRLLHRALRRVVQQLQREQHRHLDEERRPAATAFKQETGGPVSLHDLAPLARGPRRFGVILGARLADRRRSGGHLVISRHKRPPCRSCARRTWVGSDPHGRRIVHRPSESGNRHELASADRLVQVRHEG